MTQSDRSLLGTFFAVWIRYLYNAQYTGEERLSTLSRIFSLLAIIIACLGLLGMVAFSLEQRAKEISIRKVLGANAANILMMFSKKYLILIFIAFLIAVPIVNYLSEIG